MEATQTVAPTYITWDGKKMPVSSVWNYGVGGDAENARIATNLEVRGWEPKWFFVGRGKIKSTYVQCRLTGKFYPSLHYSVAPGWVEGMR
jgi:hypothetical protein